MEGIDDYSEEIVAFIRYDKDGDIYCLYYNDELQDTGTESQMFAKAKREKMEVNIWHD